jgi:hypothetical protein
VRHLLLGILLIAIYAVSAMLPASRGSHYGEVEARQLLIAASLVSDRDLDVSDEYASDAHRAFFAGDLTPTGRPIDGRLHEPYGPGFSVLIAPAYAVAGARGAELLSALLAALAFVAALTTARAVVPEPWATRGVALVALSPPAVVHSTSVHPGWAAAGLLALSVTLTVRARDDARLPVVAGAALALAPLPWLDPLVALAGLPVAGVLLHWTLRQHRRLAALIALELLSSSLIAFTALSEAVYAGLTPLAAALPGATTIGDDSTSGYVARMPALVSLWLDRDFGVVRWAPVLGLSWFGAWLLWRSRRDHIARAVPARREGEATAALAVAVTLVALLVAAFAAAVATERTPVGRWLLPALPLTSVLVAWSLRHLPRTGAVLGALTLVATAWLCAEVATGAVGGWTLAAESRAPWGPLEVLFPRWQEGSAWAHAVSATVGLSLVALLWSEWRARRRHRDRMADVTLRL